MVCTLLFACSRTSCGFLKYLLFHTAIDLRLPTPLDQPVGVTSEQQLLQVGNLFLILTKSVLLDCFLEFLTLKFTFYINGILETCILSPRRSTTRAHAHWTHSLPCTLFLRHTWWTSALHGVFFDQKLKVALFNFSPLIFLQAKANR